MQRRDSHLNHWFKVPKYHGNSGFAPFYQLKNILNKNSRLNKQSLRLSLKQARTAIPIEKREIAEAQLLAHLKQLPFFNSSSWFGIYVSLPDEFPTKQIIQELSRLGKKIACPSIISTKHCTMEFKQLKGALKAQAFGIMAPEKTNPSISIQTLDVILLPLVGFDLTGNRLGMGGGYYDRLLATDHNNIRLNEKPILIGIGFEAQYCAEIPNEPWDIKLDAVITESKATIFNSALHRKV